MHQIRQSSNRLLVSILKLTGNHGSGSGSGSPIQFKAKVNASLWPIEFRSNGCHSLNDYTAIH